MMEKIIKQQLKIIEEKENLKILFACESGSRAWGFPSMDSDYDVRFIYIRPVEWYISIDDKKDTLEFPINDELDISGWDVKKALKLFRSSNAVIYEWLQSPIVYFQNQDFVESLKNIFPEYFSIRAGIHHYLSMAKTCYKEDLEKDQVRLKKYFYAIRPVLAGKWIMENNQVPPMDLPSLRKLISNNTVANKTIDTLLQLKSVGFENDTIEKDSQLNDFLYQEMMALESYVENIDKKKGDSHTIDLLFRNLLKI